MRFIAIMSLTVSTLAGAALLAAGMVTTTLHEASETGQGEAIGTVQFIDTEHGLLVVPDLAGLAPGPHAAHIHENANCGPSDDGTPAGAAGGHYDPDGNGVHAGPYDDGHLGDFPNLFVEADGRARIPVLAPRATAADVRGRAVMIHAGADRYDAHGGHAHGKGGPRMYCGVIA